MTVASPRHRELGLTDHEYELIVEHMEREPNEVELAVFSLMWSEHCAYKHSKRLLRSLPVEGGRVVMGPGENAGAVSLGGGLACAFKVESHNHPSAVEPFQGAATGVGGILRDVFAVGARPIAILDSLRFGEVSRSPRSRYLLEQAVAGIGHYGNSIGVATVGGEIYFEDSYEANCLVNAMCLGLIQEDDLIRSAAAGRRQRRAAVRRAHGPRRDRRRVGAGFGGARRARRRQAPDRPDRRPVRGEEAARVLAGAARARAARRAAGPRRGRPDLVERGDGEQGRGRPGSRRPQGPAARGRHGAVRDHDLGVAGADAVRRRAGQGRRGRGGVREVARQRDRDRRGHHLAAPARVRRRRARRRHAGHRAGRRVPGLRPRAGRPERVDVPARRSRSPGCRPIRAGCCSRCWAAPTSPPAAGRSSSTTAWSARAPCAARRRPTRPSCSCRAAPRSRSRSTATAGASRATRTAGRSRRCSSAAPTSPASAPSRSASPTASTSATPRSPTSPGSSRARSPASPTPAAR